jgi:hypothetical protein
MRGSEEMKETLRHKEAFEYYYILGDKRSYPQVASKFTVSRTSIKKWSKAFNWQERVEQRDIEIGKGLEAKTNENVVNTKADYRAEIKVQFSIFKFMLNKLIEKFKNNEPLEIKNLDNLKIVVDSYEKLIRLDLTLIGEASIIEEIELKDAKEKLFSKINSIIAREKKTEGLKGNKKSKR